MTLKDIANLRLISQQITNSKFKSPKEIVGWMGAIQAQDFNMAKWAIGLRSNKATENDIDAAINAGEIIRTHVLRPTWHFVSADDIYWMLDLSAPGIRSSMNGRNRQLELTDKIFKKSFKIMEKVLKDENHLTRKELVSEINKAKIATDDNRASHILMNAELEGIICSGKMKGKQTTYALLNERIQPPKSLKKEEALGKLVKKYFESHGPATLHDFVWWSGLSVTEAKSAMETIKNNFISEKINSQEYWFPNSFSIPKKYARSLYLIPAFDEFLISYKDRTAAIVREHHGKAFSNNGIFWPTIVVNGQVKGLWKREIKKDTLIIETNFFDPKSKVLRNDLKKEADRFGSFLNHKIKMISK
ncbi:MAG TPA: winged helix DNA-binding domain-containing protein [Hanamia sp.]|nr:winged helix DNA-binding domain-containing protein [Hanamia sp.]